MRTADIIRLQRIAKSARRGEDFHIGCTGKQQYKSQSEAQRMVGEIKTHTSKSKKLTTYKCRNCAGWHLTSHPRKGTI